MQFNLKNQNIIKIDNLQKKYIDEFISLINEKSYNKLANCNICDGKDFLEISKKDRWNLNVYTKLCRNCGYLFTNTLLNDEKIKIFYQHYFRKIYKKFTIPTKEFYESEKHRGIEIINYLTKNNLYNKNSKALDVGCGSGAIAYIFAKFFDHSIGCDENKDYTSNVEKKNNLEIFHTNIHDNIFDGQKFDFINYCHVFEHLNDPKKELKRIKELLNKNGVLYIEVPGLKKIDDWGDGDFSLSLHIGHTQHFTLKTLINLMKKNDFKMLCGDEYIRSVWTMDENSNNYIITNEFENVLNDIKRYDNYLRIKYIKIKNSLKKGSLSFLKLLMKFTGIFKLSKYLFYKFKGNKYIIHNKNIGNIK